MRRLLRPKREVYRATRYRIYPTAEQADRMVGWQRTLRWLWNLAHEQRLMGLARLGDARLYVRYAQQQAELTELRAMLPWLAEVPCSVCQGILRDLDKAWDRAFKKLAKAPRWKSKRGPAPTLFSSAPVARVEEGAVVFPKLGSIQAVIHRAPPGVVKSVQIVRDVDQWFAVALCQVQIDIADPKQEPVVGVDRGVVNLIADSTGRIVENPRHAAQLQASIAKAQRDVARKVEQAKAEGRKPDGANIRKARERVAKLHRKVRRQRDHLLQRESKFYAATAGVIVLEKLDVRSMSASAKGTAEQPGSKVRQKAGLNRSIMSAAWSKFAGLMKYKADEKGGRVIEVPAAYSSQTCSACGHVAAGNRPSQAEFRCQACGHEEHADINAAKVIQARGLAGETVALKAPKKSLRVLKRARKDAAVPAVKACGGDPPEGDPMRQESCAARRQRPHEVRRA